MGIATAFMDSYFALKFIRLITTPWAATDAYKLGIVDANGNQLIKRAQFTSDAERAAYSKFTQLAFNVKKMLARFAFGNSTIGRYAAALHLIREHLGPNLQNKDAITEAFIDHFNLNEEYAKYLTEDTGSGAMGGGCTTTGVDIVDGSLAPTVKRKKQSNKQPSFKVEPFKEWAKNKTPEQGNE